MGRKMVCRVDVLMTADLPTQISFKSTLAPSSSAPSAVFMSRISMTFPEVKGVLKIAITD